MHSAYHGANTRPTSCRSNDSAEIKAFEKRIGHKLPSDYRSFLLKHNGGHPDPDAFTFDSGRGNEENIVLCFFPMRDVKFGDVDVIGLDGLRKWPVHAWDDLQNDLVNLYEIELDHPLLPIGTDGSSNYFCIVLDGKQSRSIVFLDHETAESTLLADSFATFLGLLKSRERSDYAFDSGPVVPDRTYEKSEALTTAALAFNAAVPGKCYCIRKGPETPQVACAATAPGNCGVCQGSGKARR